MTGQTTNKLSIVSRDGRHASFRLRGVEQLPAMAEEESCQILKQYFDFLEHSLSNHHETADIGLLQEMLLEISLLLRSGKSQLQDDGYIRLLNRLNTIYAKGLRAENDMAFARTAAYYADILESVSQFYQDYDYSHSVGLLLYYMHRLFNYQEGSWLDVFEHLISMPDSIGILQEFKDQHLQEIQNWVEEGVDNLFTIRNEQVELLAALDQSMEDLEKEIICRKESLQLQLDSDRELGIARLSSELERREIEQLGEDFAMQLAEHQSKLDIINLLDVNIEEFAGRLTDIRRRTIMRVVWQNPNLL